MNHTFLSALLAMAAIEASIGERVTNLQAELRAFLIEMEERLLKNRDSYDFISSKLSCSVVCSVP